MLKFLSGDAAERYHRNGLYFPIRVLSPAEVRAYRDRLEAVEREDALGRHPVILASPGPTSRAASSSTS